MQNKKTGNTHTKTMKDERKESMRNIGKVIGITVAVYAGVRWLLPMVIPFFIAFLLAKLLNPLVEKLNKKLHLKRAWISSILVTILIIIAIAAVLLFFGTLIGQVKTVMLNLDGYQTQAEEFWDNCCGQMEHITGIKAETIQQNVESRIPKMMEQIENKILPSLMNGTVVYARNFLVWGGICFIIVISTILILKDYHKMKNGLEHHPIGKMSLQVCRKTYEAGGAYIKAQLIIMLVITVICVLGLYFSGNKYALLAGCGIGLCDAMPFLGTGTVFVPWAVLEITQGKYMGAAIYAAIYAICSLMREILEPKLIGNKLGMHPLAVIASIYVGLNLYGLWGFALGPFSYILVREIYNCTLPELDNS